MNTNKAFLSEYITPKAVNASCMVEEGIDALGNKAKHMYMTGIFIQGSVKNANGRIYPTSEIVTAVKTIQNQIDSDISVCGEAEHPADLKINLDRISHKINKMWMEGNDGYGKLQLLPTPMGQLVETLLKSGVKLGVSSRGSGNVDEYTGRVSDFEIVTVDVVMAPSAPGAYPVAIYESLMNMKGGNKLFETLKDQDAKYNPAIQRYLKEGYIKFIRELKL